MAEIELVIKMPEENYERLKFMEEMGALNNPYLETIANGTPLPKGHGRLKDVDELYNSLEFPNQQFAKAFKDILDDAPTIIEADKEE